MLHLKSEKKIKSLNHNVTC